MKKTDPSRKKLGIIISGRCGHNHIDFSKKLDRKYLTEILNLDHNVAVFDIERDSKRKP